MPSEQAFGDGAEVALLIPDQIYAQEQDRRSGRGAR